MARGRILPAVNKAVRNATWLTDADAAVVAQARDYARRIDEASECGNESLALKVAGWYGPYLTGILKQLGCTPEGRKNLAIETKVVKGRLAELRAVRDDSRSA